MKIIVLILQTNDPIIILVIFYGQVLYILLVLINVPLVTVGIILKLLDFVLQLVCIAIWVGQLVFVFLCLFKGEIGDMLPLC